MRATFAGGYGPHGDLLTLAGPGGKSLVEIGVGAGVHGEGLSAVHGDYHVGDGHGAGVLKGKVQREGAAGGYGALAVRIAAYHHVGHGGIRLGGGVGGDNYLVGRSGLGHGFAVVIEVLQFGVQGLVGGGEILGSLYLDGDGGAFSWGQIGQQEGGSGVHQDQRLGGGDRHHWLDQGGGTGVLEGEGDRQSLTGRDGLACGRAGDQHHRLGDGLFGLGGYYDFVGDGGLGHHAAVVIAVFQLGAQGLAGAAVAPGHPDLYIQGSGFTGLDVRQQEGSGVVEDHQGLGGSDSYHRLDQRGGAGVLEAEGDSCSLVHGQRMGQGGTGDQHHRLRHALPANGGDGNLVGNIALNGGDVVVVVELQIHA